MRAGFSYGLFRGRVTREHNIEMPIALAEQRSDVTTNASMVQMESLEKHTHEGLSIESEMDETDDEIEPVG